MGRSARIPLTFAERPRTSRARAACSPANFTSPGARLRRHLGLRGLSDGSMLQRMTSASRWWGVLLAALVGLWAGAARAHEEDGGVWFEEGEPERPLLRIHGSGPYDPPPP